MAWFIRSKTPKEKLKVKKINIPEGLWLKCDSCKEIIYKTELDRNFRVCPKCSFHHRMNAYERIILLTDDESFVEKDTGIYPEDPLRFRDVKRYKERLKTYTKKTGIKDAVVCGEGTLNGRNVQICAMEFGFMGGSMGSVVGEKITRAIERAVNKKNPFITVSCSGGARMQEGILSLMQMAKTSVALAQLSEAKVPYISVLADPVTGGVTASFAMLGDVIIAEPGALVGFAGPRVIEQTIKQKLPEGFQRAEFLLEHGMIDMVVHRKELKNIIDKLLTLLR
ncbi:MAG: acetyl-CoA carboxylase carboxyltransferase subunit beta [Nitrospinae bacterium]|nr:acetyl-CoA carboxylase carboxyltransferase subunit beta [Nitrospinota bacterium]MBI3813227.1 acetyl-CoA carboxylase carboxyltransferase subunit beta [Nitrospinota bacterium]